MKKLMLTLAAAGAIASVGSAAQADHVVVPGVGYVHTDGSSYILAEGTGGSENGPLAGYVYVSTSKGCADDNGNWNGGGASGKGDGASPTCAP
ncbi:MAG TPA: hypothetical protein VNB24_07560 [Acidimicrobiales bacterium]|nr:hypothetical protein [Acidimicrobiales bacterium]